LHVSLPQGEFIVVGENVYVIGVGGHVGVVDEVIIDDEEDNDEDEEVLFEREPKPLQLARRDVVDVVGETMESVVLRSLPLLCRSSGLAVVEIEDIVGDV
jgi:hypothetical protein